MKSLIVLTLICTGLCILMPGLVNAAPRRYTFVRLVNTSPNLPPINLYADGKQLLHNISLATDPSYVQMPPGASHLQIAPVGVDVDNATAVAATLRAGGFYTVAVAGEPAAMTTMLITDDLSAPDADKARVRVYHFSPDSPAIDVFKDDDKIVYNLPFPAASDYVDIAAGSHDLQVRPATVDDPVLASSDVIFTGGSIYSIFTIGALTPTSNIALKVALTSPPALIPAQLPMSGGTSLPIEPIAILAGLLVAGGFALRRRVCWQ